MRRTPKAHAEICERRLGYGNGRENSRKEMKPVVGQPHSKPERDECIAVPHGEGYGRQSAAVKYPGGPSRRTKQHGGQQDKKSHKNDSEYRRFVADTKQLTEPSFKRVHRANHAECVEKRAKCKYHDQRGKVFAPGKISDARPQGVGHQFRCGQPAGNTHIVVRACVHTIETKRAVHVSHFTWLKQGQLAPALQNHKIVRTRCRAGACASGRGDLHATSSNAILGRATVANPMVANLYFQRRYG